MMFWLELNKKMGKVLTTDIFIERVKKVHNNFYNYDLVNYKNNDSVVKIICPTHGIFEQNAKSHLDGHGCFKCKNKYITTEEFIKRSNLIHNFKYGYDLVVFKNFSEKIRIYCNRHGIFEQSPKLHLRGHGCPKCANNVYTKQEIIEKAGLLHNYKYTYDENFVINKRMSDTFIKINCPKHGNFLQRINNHLHQLNGCPLCNESKGEMEIEKILKDNFIIYERQKKFDFCKNKKKLSFDFYLSDFNICLEFDGIQHFEVIYGFKELLKVHHNDLIKNNFCFDNNIRLVRIKYNENINDILQNIISEIKITEMVIK
jgi:hypothetical protein